MAKLPKTDKKTQKLLEKLWTDSEIQQEFLKDLDNTAKKEYIGYDEWLNQKSDSYKWAKYKNEFGEIVAWEVDKNRSTNAATFEFSFNRSEVHLPDNPKIHFPDNQFSDNVEAMSMNPIEAKEIIIDLYHNSNYQNAMKWSKVLLNCGFIGLAEKSEISEILTHLELQNPEISKSQKRKINKEKHQKSQKEFGYSLRIPDFK